MRAAEANVHVPAGTTVFSEGDAGDCAYYLESGEVEVSIVREGRRVVLCRRVPGEMFGEMAIVDGRPRSATVATVAPSSFVLITREQLRSRLDQADPVLRLCLSLLLDRLRSTLDRVRGLDAAGVEHAVQAELLAGLGVAYGQGFLFSQALPADAAARLLTRPPPDPRPAGGSAAVTHRPRAVHTMARPRRPSRGGSARRPVRRCRRQRWGDPEIGAVLLPPANTDAESRRLIKSRAA